jgi:hypothetical protein
LKDLLALGYFEPVAQETRYRFKDTYTEQVPRLRDMRCDSSEPFSYVSLWTETVYMLRVEDVEPIVVKDIYAWNPNLMEERFATTIETAYITVTSQIERGVRIIPKILSSVKDVPIFIPSIPRICDALLDQLRYRKTHAENFPKVLGNRPSYYLTNFIRYLYLERPSQQKLLLPLLADRNRGEMELMVNKFMRKPTYAESKMKRRTNPVN